MYNLIGKIKSVKGDMYIVKAGSSVSVMSEKEYKSLMWHENNQCL